MTVLGISVSSSMAGGRSKRTWASRLAVMLAAAAVATSCGRAKSIRGGTGGMTAGGGGAAGAAGGIPAGGAGGGGPGATGGAAGATVATVDPSVSAQWTWHACGTIAPSPSDLTAVMAPDGHAVAVIDVDSHVRVHELASPTTPHSVGSADFAVYAPDGTLYLGKRSPEGEEVSLEPVMPAGPALTFGGQAGAICGHAGGAFSRDGSLFLVHGGAGLTPPDGQTCVWRVADRALVAVLSSGEALRGATVVGLSCAPDFRVNTQDFSGTEVSSVVLDSRAGYCPLEAQLSPAADRVAGEQNVREDTGAILWDADTGARLVTVSSADWTAAGSATGAFTPSGDRVLLGDGIFSTKDGARIATGRLSSKTARSLLILAPNAGTVLALDQAVGSRAILFSLPDGRPLEMLGPPPLAPTEDRRKISALALSGDGALLVVQTYTRSAFVLRVGEHFEQSATLWPMWSSIGLTADISASATFAAVSGDERQLYRVADGALLWNTIPPAEVSVGCSGTQLRLSPSGRWAAGTGYSNAMEVFPTASATSWQRLAALPTGCQDTAAFSRDETLMATSTPSLYRTGEKADDWQPVWAKTPLPPPSDSSEYLSRWGNEIRFSPDETKLLVSQCKGWACNARLYAVADGALLRELPALAAPHPSFSPEGHWVVAGSTLLHLPSGATRPYDDSGKVTVAVFTPSGDLIAGASDQSVTRYCRDP